MTFTQFKRSSCIVGAILAIGAVSLGALSINENNKINSTKTSIVSAKAQYRHEKSQQTKKRRVIHKTIPSSYKLMMVDGRTVSNAENTILKVNKASHGNVNPNSKQIRDANASLSQMLTENGQTNNDRDYSQPWVNNYDSHVQMLPGAANDDNMFTCAFLIKSSNGQYEAFLTATYDPSVRKFDDIQYFGSGATGDPNDNLKDFRTRLHQAMAQQRKKAQAAKAQKAHNKAKAQPQHKPNAKANAKKPQPKKK